MQVEDGEVVVEGGVVGVRLADRLELLADGYGICAGGELGEG